MKIAIAACIFLCGCQQQKYKLVEVEPEKPPPLTDTKPAPPPELAQRPDQQQQLGIPQYTETDWRVLRGLNTRTGEVSQALKKLEGGTVRLTGYMVPFADEYESANEFLLVPQAGMCVHVPPPPANQIVLVQMTAGAAKVTWSKPVAVSGILEIAQADSPYGKVSFKIDAIAAQEQSDGIN